MHTRKTEDIFFICLKKYNGKEQIMRWKFKDEISCDTKLAELNGKKRISEENPILDPFSQFNNWYKRSKRVPIIKI